MQVDGARFVVGMEEQLLSAGQARHSHTTKRALVESFWRIVELPPAQVGLAAVTGCVEDDRVNVDPTTPLSDQFDTDWSPVSLHAVAPAPQNAQRHCLVAGVHRQVEVTVQSGLPTNQWVGLPVSSPMRVCGPWPRVEPKTMAYRTFRSSMDLPVGCRSRTRASISSGASAYYNTSTIRVRLSMKSPGFCGRAVVRSC